MFCYNIDSTLCTQEMYPVLKKCRKHSPAACVFYISLVFSNARCVLSQCNTRLRLLYLSINNYPMDSDLSGG